MAEEARINQEPEKQKFLVPHLCLNAVKNSTQLGSSAPSSPATLRKTSSAKYNCLCSPTTHVGSFRCRYHRNSGLSLTRSSISVGSKLSDLAAKPTGMCDALHAQ